jgi:arylsulfatase A-like enzyme
MDKKLNAETKPNILFILLDDFGWTDCGCYGSSFYETPRLDELAEQGARFTNAYAACPVCSPTRASILTGKYPARLGMTQWLGGVSEGKLAHVPYVDHMSSEEFSLARALKSGGYDTWHVGKWHLSKHGERRFETYPDKHGFDVNIGGCNWGMPMNGFFAPYGLETLEEGPIGEYLTDRLTDEAIGLIENRGDQPWFMHLSHYAVHIPIECHAELVEKYRRKSERLALDKVDPFVAGERFPCKHLEDQNVLRRTVQSDPTYAAMVENVDWNIGRVLDSIEASGQMDNTIVIFFSDNGGLATSEGSPTCNAPLQEGKGWMYEGGTREPLIVRWPGRIESGVVLDNVVTSTDFYPTLLECAGLPLLPEQHCDGVSMLPLLEGNPAFDRGAVFWHYPHYSNQGGVPGCSIRDGDWKLIEFFEEGRLELYNLKEDIGEEEEVGERYPDTRDALQAKLHEWQKSIGAKIPKPNPNFGE